MRLATAISLLLFASTACALQLHHDERRDGSSVIRRRSFRPISRRRLVLPRADSLEHSLSPTSLPDDWTAKEVYGAYNYEKSIGSARWIDHTQNKGAFEVTLNIDGKKVQLIVQENFIHNKQLDPALLQAHLKPLRQEVQKARNEDELYGVLFDGSTIFHILKKVGGHKKETDEAKLKARHYCGIMGWNKEDLPNIRFITL